tara:strand:+ start:4540 stop:5334 length:795 start_codon:yes stop_codon:yes gene_type:complete
MNTYHNLKKIIQIKNHPSILLHSYKTENCKNIILDILDDLYSVKKLTNAIKFKNINYEKSIYHYYINLKNIDFIALNNLLKEIIKCDNYYLDMNKLIILDNFKLFNNNQKNIKNLIEKNMNIKFIILTSNINSIYNGLINLLLNLKIKNEELDIKYIGNILYNNDLYNDLIFKLEFILKSKMNKKLMKEIKLLSYLLLLNNIEIRYLFSIIFDIFINNKKNISKLNSYIIHLFNYSNININYMLIYYEYIIIKCNYIMNLGLNL